MHRDRLRAWLEDPGRTWRWNRGQTDGYRGVEARGDTLRWFSWSHDIAQGEGGVVEEVQQSAETFLRDGAPVDGVPPPVIEALRARLTRHRPGSEEDR